MADELVVKVKLVEPNKVKIDFREPDKVTTGVITGGRNMREYDAGETAYIEIETRDKYDDLVDPSSVIIDIFDTDGNKVSTGSAAKEGTGNYFYTYTIPATAVSGSTYTTKATVINSSDFVTIKRARFKVRR